MRAGNFICRGDAERGRLLDMNRRLRPIEAPTIVLFLIAGALGIPVFGWLPLVPTAIGAVAFGFAQRRLDHYRRPEFVLAASWLFTQVAIAVGIALANGPNLYLLSLLIFPVMLAGVAYPTRVVFIGTAFTAVLMIGVGLVFAEDAVRNSPPTLFEPVVILLAAAIPAAAVRREDIASRATAGIDELTGLFNRVALEARLAELSHEASLAGERIAVIIADVDRFKAINDQHGHAAGDEVLKELAYRVRKVLRAFEPAYRLGGEEFIFLLTGTDADGAPQLAERLRDAVGAWPIHGHKVTISLGVAANAVGEPFDYNDVFQRADSALYESKRQGRDQVCVDRQTAEPTKPSLASPRAAVQDGQDRRSASAGRRRTDIAAEESIESFDNSPMQVAGEDTGSESWLIKDGLQRRHLLDLQRRLFETSQPAFAMAFLAVLAASPWYGWQPLIPVIFGSVVYNMFERRVDRLSRPEYALGLLWLLTQAANAGSFMLADGAPLFALPFFILMLIGTSAVFPARGVLVGVTATAVFMALATISLSAQQVMHQPGLEQFTHQPGLVAPAFALLGGIGLIGWAIGRSAVDHRSAAVVDKMTGLLNRRALEARMAELAHQSAVTDKQVAVVVGDVDRFKSINDERGHACGDEVLKEIAQRVRRELGSFDPVYRFGGEEFVVPLADADLAAAAEIAERLRAAVAAGPIEGIDVTMSVGVAISDPDETFEFENIFTRADEALYEAKHAGRDQVCVDGLPALQAAAVA